MYWKLKRTPCFGTLTYGVSTYWCTRPGASSAWPRPGANGKAGKRVTAGRRAALITSRINAREKPMPAMRENGPTVEELARDWLQKHVESRCKPNTKAISRGLSKGTSFPRLGRPRCSPWTELGWRNCIIQCG